MIEPIKTTIQQGTSKATAVIGENSLKIKFEHASPEFQEKVVNMLDEFIWSDKKDKDIEAFKIDTFEKQGENKNGNNI